VCAAIAEAAAEPDRPRRISREDAAQAADGLLDEAHLTVFTTWWGMGGAQSPPTISEIAAWPAALRHDMLLLMGEMGEAQAAARRRKGPRKGAKK
jgi:hypothetical protein